jgi:hypothetical protein
MKEKQEKKSVKLKKTAFMLLMRRSIIFFIWKAQNITSVMKALGQSKGPA